MRDGGGVVAVADDDVVHIVEVPEEEVKYRQFGDGIEREEDAEKKKKKKMMMKTKKKQQ